MPSNKTQLTEEEVQGWGLNEVSGWLKSAKLESCIEEFNSLQIDGQRLLLLTWDEFKTLESMKEEKKKKLLKKALSNLPGRAASSSTKKGKKAANAQKRSSKADLPNPVGGYPPIGSEAPALPPRPGRAGPLPPPPSSSSSQPSPGFSRPPPISSQPPPPGPPSGRPPSFMSSQPPPLPSSQPPPLPSSQPPPLPSSQPPSSRTPRPPNMRPPLSHPVPSQPPGYPGQFQDTSGYQDESEDIYDAVPEDQNIEESEDIYDDGNLEVPEEDEDSFDDEDDEAEEEYEESASIQQQLGPNKPDITALKAKFYAYGIGTLDGRHMGLDMGADEEPIDDEIYDIPPEGENEPQGFHPAPPPMAPPPPTGPPPEDQAIDDEIYDCAPEGEGVPQDDFGYGDNEDIYDIADDDPPGQAQEPPMRLPQSGPLPGGPPGVSFNRPPMRPMGKPLPPQVQPPINMPPPPTHPPEEDIGDEEIYDCMDEGEEIEEPKPPAPSFGMGARQPPMRQPINLAPSPPSLRPPINQTVADVQRAKLQSSANQQPPPRPGSGSKPVNFQEIQQSKLQATSGQAPPLRPSSSSKPLAVPPPPPVSAPVEENDDDDDDQSGGGLASELAAMKRRLKSGSGSTPPIERKPTQIESSKPPPPPPAPALSSSAGSNDLASSIAQARNRLRTGTTIKDRSPKDRSPKQQDEPQRPKFEFPKPSKDPELPKKATPPSSPKPPHVPKPQVVQEKPQKPQPSGPKPPKPSAKPAIAPKGKRIAALSGKFLETGEKDVGGGGGAVEKKAIELDRSPLTGRKVDRKQSVKELTQHYSSPESGEEISPSHQSSVNQKRLSQVGGDNPAMNVFKKKQIEAGSGSPPLPGKQPAPPPVTSPFNKAPPPPSPSNSPFNKAPPPPSPSNEGDQPPLPGRFPPGNSIQSNNDPPPLPGRPRLQLPEGPGRPLPGQGSAPPLPGRPSPQQQNDAPFPGRSRPHPNEPQPHETPPLPGRPQDSAPPLPGRPRPPQQNDAPPIVRPLPQNDTAPPLPGRPRPEPPSPGSGRPQFQDEPQQPSFKPPLRPPIGEPPLPKKAGGLTGQSWYHASLDRKNAEAKIKRYQKDGTFIVRDNTRNPGEFSLSLWHDGGVRHLRIRKRPDGQFVLGEEKADEVPFKDVVDLVHFYKTEPVVLKSGGQTPLKYECPH